jgi:hypothetical protein
VPEIADFGTLSIITTVPIQQVLDEKYQVKFYSTFQLYSERERMRLSVSKG